MTLNLQLPPNLPSELKSIQIVDISDMLPVNPKYTWPQRSGDRALEELTTIVFHHDAWPKRTSAKFNDLQLAREIAGDHIRSVKNIPGGDPGFPYHGWVRNGILYLCNPITWRLYGVKDANSFTVHICLSGDYVNGDIMTDADRKAMYLAYFLFRGGMPKFQSLKGHKQLSQTACPGYDMDKVRSDIMDIELNQALNETPNDTIAKIYAAYSRFNDLYKIATTPGKFQAEAQRKCLQIGKSMEDAGIIVAK